MKNTNRLFLFPELPLLNDGYGIAVLRDYERFKFNSGDYLIFFTDYVQSFPIEIRNDISEKGANLTVIRRNRSLKHTIYELVNLRHPSHFYGNKYHSELKLPEITWDYVFCGDVVFYYHVKRFIKTKLLFIRFHNLWSKLVWRAIWKGINPGLKFSFFNLWLGSRLEKAISKDVNANKAFINDTDLQFFYSITGDKKLELLPVVSNLNISKSIESLKIWDNDTLNIIWFGSVVAHNVLGVEWFIKNVFIPLKLQGKNVKFYLYGKQTEKFFNPNQSIYAFGKFKGDGVPLSGNGIFINPDLLGGGVKLKMQFFIENGLNVLSTPFGLDGYNSINDIKNLFVKNPEEWLSFFNNLFIEKYQFHEN